MDLEPSERNPAQIRKTVFILILMMIVGAVCVLVAYDRHEKSQDPNRPPITAKISKNLAAKNQNDQLVSLADLEGKVWFVAPICVTQLDENKHAIAMMQELEKHYVDNDQVNFAFVSIEGNDQGVTPAELKKVAVELGLDSPKVLFLTTGDTKKQRGYIKDQLRLGIVSERSESERSESGGKWKFPSQIALIDQGMHLRQRYDFKEAYDYQKQAEAELTKNSNLSDKEGFDRVLYAVKKLKETLYQNTEYVLNEKTTGSIK